MEKKQSHVLASLFSDPLYGSKLFAFFFWFSRSFCHFGPKVLKPMEKQKQKVSPHVPCPASFCFFVFSRFSLLCQSNNVSCSFFFVFLVSCFLGSWEKCSPWQTSIGTAFTPPHFILMCSLSYFFWLLSHQRKCTIKTALSPTSSGTPLDWCFIGMPRFWLLIFKPGTTKSDI